jgi:rubredoxin
MKLGPSHHIPSSECTNCGFILDGATGIAEDGHKGDLVPDPGDATVCIMCGHLMVFTDELKLRDLTDAEIIKAAGDKRILMAQKALKAARERR